MEENFNTTNKLNEFLKKNKLKLLSLSGIILVILLSVVIFGTIKTNKNELIAEKYIQAGLYLSSGKKNKSKKISKRMKSQSLCCHIQPLRQFMNSNFRSQEKTM